MNGSSTPVVSQFLKENYLLFYLVFGFHIVELHMYLDVIYMCSLLSGASVIRSSE